MSKTCSKKDVSMTHNTEQVSESAAVAEKISKMCLQNTNHHPAFFGSASNNCSLTRFQRIPKTSNNFATIKSDRSDPTSG